MKYSIEAIDEMIGNIRTNFIDPLIEIGETIVNTYESAIQGGLSGMTNGVNFNDLLDSARKRNQSFSTRLEEELTAFRDGMISDKENILTLSSQSAEALNDLSN